jgi:Lrp/AsnC family transcriptional regulator, regulator for asnA, asnC and gidA
MTSEGRRLDDLDAIDVAIIRMLQESGRRTNAEIARTQGVSEPTIRKRIDRMIGDGIIKVVAVLNPRTTGYEMDVLIGIRVEAGKLLDVGEKLAEREDVVYLGYITGRHDIRDVDALFACLNVELPRIGGIVSTETYTVLRAGKINYDWKLPSEFTGKERSG